jgi:hypothetical protein
MENPLESDRSARSMLAEISGLLISLLLLLQLLASPFALLAVSIEELKGIGGVNFWFWLTSWLSYAFPAGLAGIGIHHFNPGKTHRRLWFPRWVEVFFWVNAAAWLAYGLWRTDGAFRWFGEHVWWIAFFLP